MRGLHSDELPIVGFSNSCLSRVMACRRSRSAADDRDKIFADIVYRVCRQLLRCGSRSTVARFIANDATITNLRDLHEEIDSFMKKFGINNEAATRVNWLESWTIDKEEQREELREKVLDAELTNEQDKVDAVTHLQFLIKNLGKEESADRSTAERVIQRVGGSDASALQIPAWFISRYNIAIEGWDAVGKSRYVKGRWVKSAVMISKCNLEAAQFEEIAATWRKLGHPNVLDLFGACHVGQPRFFVCDIAKNETLQGYLRNNRDHITRLTKLHEAAARHSRLQLCDPELCSVTSSGESLRSASNLSGHFAELCSISLKPCACGGSASRTRTRVAVLRHLPTSAC